MGVSWMRDAFRLFMRRPLPFAGMFISFLVVALLVTIVPLIGGVVMLMSLPLSPCEPSSEPCNAGNTIVRDGYKRE